MSEQRIAFFTSRDGVKIAYATYGPSEGQPLVFELAWMSQESVWNYAEGRRFFAALGRGRRLVTYDRRGMGASDPHAMPLDLDDEVADLLGLVDHLDLGEIDVFSMFGTVAIPYASRYPDRIRRLILWAPSPRHRAYPAAVHAMMRDAWNLFTRSAATVICPSGPAEAQHWCVEAIRGSAAQQSS